LFSLWLPRSVAMSSSSPPQAEAEAGDISQHPRLDQRFDLEQQRPGEPTPHAHLPLSKPNQAPVNPTIVGGRVSRLRPTMVAAACGRWRPLSSGGQHHRRCRMFSFPEFIAISFVNLLLRWSATARWEAQVAETVWIANRFGKDLRIQYSSSSTSLLEA
jgi:hypothetical protein